MLGKETMTEKQHLTGRGHVLQADSWACIKRAVCPSQGARDGGWGKAWGFAETAARMPPLAAVGERS